MATSHTWQRPEAPTEWTRGFERSTAQPGKRGFDIVLSITGLVLGLPVMALCAAGVQLQSSGAVFCRTRCWGRGARAFDLMGLRTSDAAGRMTCAGRVMQWLGLDRLPRLVNVIRGEMSIVGPAPVPAGERDEASVRHLRRFELTPGMTGLRALGAFPGSTPGAYFSPDAAYRSHWSVWLDLTIVARTLMADGLDS